MKKYISVIHSNAYEKCAIEDFEKIKKCINKTSLHPVSTGKSRLHGDYHLGQIKCLNRYIYADIVDLSSIHKGIWIQICDRNSTRFISSSCSSIQPAYVNTLIKKFAQYKAEDSLKPGLSLRPFGFAYEYPG